MTTPSPGMLLDVPLLTADEVAHARRLLATADWPPGRVSAGPQAARVKNNEQLPLDSEVGRALQPLILKALDRSPRFLAAALPRKVYPPRFNRYAGHTNAFGGHIDGSIRFTEEGMRIRTDLSCTVFLTDPDAYDGGELVIHGLGAAQRIKLPAGRAILYPATTVHEVTPVTRGERIACFFWIESMVRSLEQRMLLLQFDAALTALRERDGEGEEAVALVGTYHNLIRMWAET